MKINIKSLCFWEIVKLLKKKKKMKTLFIQIVKLSSHKSIGGAYQSRTSVSSSR